MYRSFSCGLFHQATCHRSATIAEISEPSCESKWAQILKVRGTTNAEIYDGMLVAFRQQWEVLQIRSAE
jgi:hypothetical protein